MSCDSDKLAWMILGVDRLNRPTVAVVVGTEDAEKAKAEFACAYPRHQILSWPQMLDLKKSIAIMERAVAGEDVGECPVLRVHFECEDSSSPEDPAMDALRSIRLALVEHGLGDPFGNNSEQFVSAAFEVRSHAWDDPDDERGIFKWRDFEAKWYKHLDRETSFSRILTADQSQAMLDECLGAIVAHCERGAK